MSQSGFKATQLVQNVCDVDFLKRQHEVTPETTKTRGFDQFPNTPGGFGVAVCSEEQCCHEPWLRMGRAQEPRRRHWLFGLAGPEEQMWKVGPEEQPNLQANRETSLIVMASNLQAQQNRCVFQSQWASNRVWKPGAFSLDAERPSKWWENDKHSCRCSPDFRKKLPQHYHLLRSPSYDALMFLATRVAIATRSKDATRGSWPYY